MNIQLTRTGKLLLGLVAVLTLVAIPWLTSDYFVMMFIRVMFFSMLTMSLCYLAGELGCVSLMQASFFGISGYLVAILQTQYHLPFPIPPLVALVAAVLTAMLCGFLTIRAKGVYFLMLTLVLGQLFWALASQWASVTNGDSGITNIYAPIFFWFSAEESKTVFYFFQLLFFVGITAFLHALRRSPFGLMVKGVRDSETRMAMLGYRVATLRYVAFVFAAFVAAVGGVFFAYFTGLINPHAASLSANIDTLLAGILGGIHTLGGAFLGTVIIKAVDVVLSGVTNRYQLIMGVMFLVVILFAPKGILGSTQHLLENLTKRVLGAFGLLKK
ncbi:MAG: branched-chain amino acid ABC transporter permease [Spirochaetales bacterium]|jgi:branched-chain amino acid transport system permease protein|nr:branched-chain amino acid ABC transporter permease [Spirochaetales bacterium]